MKIERLRVRQFRNIEEIELIPCDGVNVIYGSNAQGKTNLLESIWLFSGFRSFRGAKDPELIRFNEPFLRNELDFYGFGRSQNAKLIIGRESRRIILNGVPLKTQTGLVGNFCCVVFSPTYLSLVKGSPSERRKFIDAAICQVRAAHAGSLISFHKTLDQRNAYLKQARQSRPDPNVLEVWDRQLAEDSAEIVKARIEYLRQLSKKSEEIHAGLSGDTEQLAMRYSMRTSVYGHDRIDDAPSADDIYILLQKNLERDSFLCTTSIGAHKDDIEITINALQVRSYASQGQQRSAALALKLGEAAILGDQTGEKPVALLDDVMSELDADRQDYILNHIRDWQVFITCCEPETVLRLCEGKSFRIEGGKII